MQQEGAAVVRGWRRCLLLQCRMAFHGVFVRRLSRLMQGLVLGLLGFLPSVSHAHDVMGNLNAVGSDTMAELMLRWGERLEQSHPGVRLQLQASGSASAPAALIAGTTLLGPMSRQMLPRERASFTERYGYPPTAITVGKDALLVVVNRHNPIESLSLRQLDAIFSDNRQCGGEEAIEQWQQLGQDEPPGRIHLYGRNRVSGTHAMFRRIALCGGYFRNKVNVFPGSAAVVSAVGSDPLGIGYAGLNHLTADVHVVAIGEPGQAVVPSRQTLRNNQYPMARHLLIYANLPPGGSLPPTEQAFLDLVLSPSGQEIVEELGFVTLPIPQLNLQRRQLGLPELGSKDDVR